MIATDSSSLIAFFTESEGEDCRAVEHAIAHKELVLPPVVVSEIFSAQEVELQVRQMLHVLPLLPINDGYWQRAGQMRSALLRSGYKARLGDCLIAQSCLDHDVPLITRDRDFRHFSKHCGLQLAVKAR